MSNNTDYVVKNASSVVLVRNTDQKFEVLLLKRASTLSFAPSTWVFPGGKVDKQDDDYDHHAGLIAGVRELHEEAGLEVEPQQLNYFFQITTPYGRVRFKTAFFVAEHHGSPEVQVDGSEIVDHQWVKAEQALSSFRKGEMPLMIPTVLILMRLSLHDNAGAAVAGLSQPPNIDVLPRQSFLENGCRINYYPGDEGYDENSSVKGGLHRIVYAKDGKSWDYIYNLDDPKYPRLDGGYCL